MTNFLLGLVIMPGVLIFYGIYVARTWRGNRDGTNI